VGFRIRVGLRASRERFAHVPAVGYAQSPNEWRVRVNKTTKTALYAKKKDELVDFAWIMVKMYNESERQRIYLESVINKQGEQK
jgi:hypothetical protein